MAEFQMYDRYYLQLSMIDPQYIHVDESIRTGRLKGNFSLTDRLETFVWIGISTGAMLVSLYLVYESAQFPSLRSATGVGALLAAICAYVVYRSAMLNKLQRVETLLLAKDIKDQVLNYSAVNKYLVEFKSDRLLIIYDPGPAAYLQRKSTKLIYVLISDNAAHFCVSGGGRESLRSPVLFAQWSLGSDMRKMLA